MKGAPERILERCAYYVDNAPGMPVASETTPSGVKPIIYPPHLHSDNCVEVPITAEFKNEWMAAYAQFGMVGERVLGLAYKVDKARPVGEYKRQLERAETEEGTGEGAAGEGAKKTGQQAAGQATQEAYPTKDLVFCGLISLVDPPKDGVREAVDTCRGAGVRVVMVTGDHPLTAEAIARKVHIITKKTQREIAHEKGVPESEIPLSHPEVEAVVLPGHVLPGLTEADWDVILEKKEVVFARTSPEQKFAIVTHYQNKGHIVAVTGDGTNDAPALKQADIGISMGSILASDVAREAADMVSKVIRDK